MYRLYSREGVVRVMNNNIKLMFQFSFLQKFNTIIFLVNQLWYLYGIEFLFLYFLGGYTVNWISKNSKHYGLIGSWIVGLWAYDIVSI